MTRPSMTGETFWTVWWSWTEDYIVGLDTEMNELVDGSVSVCVCVCVCVLMCAPCAYLSY